MTSRRKNYFWQFSQYIFLILTAIFTLKLNINNYGETQFGVWLLLASIWKFGNALDLGFSTSTIKYVAEYNKHEKENLNKLISSTMLFFLVLGVLIFIFGHVVGNKFYIENEKLVPVESRAVFLRVFNILSLAFYFRFVAIFFKSILEGLENFAASSKIIILYNSILVTGVIVIFIFKLEIIYLAILYLFNSVLYISIFLYFFRRRISFIKIHPKYFDYQILKKTINFSFSIQLSNVFASFIDPVIKYILGSYYNVSSISIYEIAKRITLTATNLFFTTFKPILPKASQIRSREEAIDFVEKESLQLSKMGNLFSGIIYGALLPFITLFIIYWFDTEAAILFFILLALPETINTFGFSQYNLILGMGKTKIIVLIQLINLVFSVLFLLFTTLMFNSVIGLLGYYFSVILANLILLFVIRRISGISIEFYLQKAKFKNLLFLNCALILLVVIKTFFTEYFFYFAFLHGILIALIYWSEIKSYSKHFYNLARQKNILK